MKLDPEVHHRRSIRLKHYDYSLPGAYFVSICTQRRESLFGSVIDEEMRLNGVGQMVLQVWEDLPIKFSCVELDQFVVMPNHLHGIIVIHNRETIEKDVGATPVVAHDRAGTRPAPTKHLGDIVGGFKLITTDKYIASIKKFGWEPFDRRLWQRNYCEHVIRSEAELKRVRQYIVENPIKWALDPENPAAKAEEVSEPWQL